MTDLGPFKVPYDHRMSFADLIDAGLYNYVSPKVGELRKVVESASNRAWLIAAKRRPMMAAGDPYRSIADPQEGSGIKTVELGVLSLWGQLSPQAAPAYADLLGKRLARPEELLSFAAARPSLPDGLWVLAIGGNTDIIDGRLPTLGLRVENGGKKYLLANRICRCAFRHSKVLLASL